jgi:hypothetical protein
MGRNLYVVVVSDRIADQKKAILRTCSGRSRKPNNSRKQVGNGNAFPSSEPPSSIFPGGATHSHRLRFVFSYALFCGRRGISAGVGPPRVAKICRRASIELFE